MVYVVSGGGKMLTQTSPLAQLLAIRHLDQGNLVLGAKRNNQLLVGLLLARLVEDAHVGLATVERLAGLAETAGEPVVDERELEDALERLEHAHLALACGCIGADLDLGGGLDGGCGLFSVRLGFSVSMLIFVKMESKRMGGSEIL